jgi:LEA14-like dessication related protein
MASHRGSLGSDRGPGVMSWLPGAHLFPDARGVRARVVLCAGLLAMAMIGCGTVARSQQPPTVQLVGLTLLEATADGQHYRVRLLFENPNAVPITVSRMTFRVRLAGEGYVRGESSTPLSIEPGARETLGVDVTSEVVSSLSRLMALVQGPEHALPYEIAGDLYLDSRRPTPYSFRASGQVPLSMMR